jgi:hypothetical protein
MTSRKAVGTARAIAFRRSLTSRADFCASHTSQKNTASTSTGTVSLVSDFSAPNGVTISRWSIHIGMTSSTSMLMMNNRGPQSPISHPTPSTTGFSRSSAALREHSSRPINSSLPAATMASVEPLLGASSRWAAAAETGNNRRQIAQATTRLRTTARPARCASEALSRPRCVLRIAMRILPILQSHAAPFAT